MTIIEQLLLLLKSAESDDERNRILLMLEREQKHSHWMSLAGLFSAFAFGAGATGGGVFLCHEGKDTQGLAALMGPILLFASMLAGRQRSDKFGRLLAFVVGIGLLGAGVMIGYSWGAHKT